MTISRIALRLAFSTDIRQRWRQVSLIISVLLATLAGLLAVAVAQSADRSAEHRDRRTLLVASKAEDAVLRADIAAPIVGNRQIPVIWLDPTPGNENNPDALPPGLREFPAAGAAVVSPGVIRDGLSAADFGFKNSSAGLGENGAIGDAGLETRTERRVYARPAADRSLVNGKSVYLGQGFNSNGTVIEADSRQIAFESDPDMVSRAEAILPLVIVIFVPLCFLLFGAARAMSPVRQERAEFLWRLGVPRRSIRWLLATETCALAAGGVSLALMCWQGKCRSITRLPLTEVELLPGSLNLSPGKMAATALLVLALTMISAVVGPITLRRKSASVKHARLLTLPLFLGLWLMLTNPILPVDEGGRVSALMLALVLVLCGIPISLPAIIQLIAPYLARTAKSMAWLASRRLSHSARNLTRPAALVGALVLICACFFGIMQGSKRSLAGDDLPPPRAQVYEISWVSARAGDALIAANLLPNFATIPTIRDALPPIAVGGMTTGPPPTGKALFSNCQMVDRLAQQLAVSGCAADGSIGPEFTATFASLTRRLPKISSEIPSDVSSVVAIRSTRVEDLAIDRALAGKFPGMRANLMTGEYTANVRLGWLHFYWALGGAILLLAMLRELGDRGLLALSTANILRRISLTEREISQVNLWILGIPMAVSVPVGFIGAVTFSRQGTALDFTGPAARQTVTASLLVCFAVMMIFIFILRIGKRIYSIK